MDDARTRRRAERKRNNSTDAETSEAADGEKNIAQKTQPVLTPIKESRSQGRRRRISVNDEEDDSATPPMEVIPSGSVPEDEGRQTERKRRKKSKKTKIEEASVKSTQESGLYSDSTLTGHIQALSDDIVDATEPVSQNVGGDIANGLSQPINNVFVEFPKGFKEMGRSDLKRKSSAFYISTPGVETAHATTTIDIAVQCQLITHGIFSIMHGILAGLAICSCIMISYLQKPFHSETDFLHHYKEMAYALEAIFFVLLTLCLLNALDRCDPGHSLSLFIQGLITFDATAILVALYAVALILSLAIVNTEDKMGLLTFSNDTLQVDSGEIHGWWVVIVCRCILASLAWIVFALRPFKFSLMDRLQELPDNAEMPTYTDP